MFEQIKLEYGFDALEPYIDALTMQTHYLKHHATYTKNLNDLVQNNGINEKNIEVIFADWKQNYDEKDALGKGIRNNGGGFYNHNLYFGQISPKGGGEPQGILADKISTAFGNFEACKDQLTKLAMGQFGSGWAWLVADASGTLSASASPNQDNPILESEGKLYPILAIDVWEHAYYLKYKNLRAEYINAFFEVVDWKKVEKNYFDSIEKLK